MARNKILDYPLVEKPNDNKPRIEVYENEGKYDIKLISSSEEQNCIASNIETSKEMIESISNMLYDKYLVEIYGSEYTVANKITSDIFNRLNSKEQNLKSKEKQIMDCANSSSDKSDGSDKSVTSEVTKPLLLKNPPDLNARSDRFAKVRTIFLPKSDESDKSQSKQCEDSHIYPIYNDLSPVTSVTLSLQKKEGKEGNKKQSDINDKSDNSFELDFDSVSEAVGKSKLALIYSWLYVNKKMNRKQLSEKLDVELNTITVTMNRSKDRFLEDEPVDGLISYKLSPIAVEEVEQKLIGLKKIRESIANKKEEKSKQEEDSKKLKEDIEKSLDDINPTIEGRIITIDFKELILYNQELADKLLDNPIEAIDDIKLHYSELEISDVRFINLPNTQKRTAEGIRCKDIDRLLTVEGRCVSLSTVRPVITNAKFECSSCGSIISIVQIEKKFKEPSRCSCGRRGGFKIVAKDLRDSSNVVVEDLQDNTENPNTQRINARIQNFLVEKENIGIFNLGDEVKITGILRTVESFDRGAATINLGYLFEIIDAQKKQEEILVENFTEEDIEKIKEISKIVDEEGMGDVCNSFAPDVYGYEYIKNAIMLQACSKKNEPKQSATRNKPNILLIGDPGIAKSVICKFAMAITPGSRKASGGGSSAVGITASVVKEEESMGGYRIEAGALPLAKELLFLDEMNNLTDDDKPKLQEAMSEQIISINKANLHVNLKVTAGVLATANPKNGHFISDVSYNKQFNIPSPILNRFDEVFIMKDIPDKKRDEAIADIMIRRKRGQIKPKYSINDLKKFFAYVRNTQDPEVSDEIANKLKEIYSDSRKNRNTDVIINPRFMEALSRMIEASAKMRLSKTVEEKDIERALEILSHSHFKANEYKNFEFGGTQ